MSYFLRRYCFLSGYAAALLLAFCVVLLASAGPAVAHDELTGSTPAPGAALETAPESVELTFSNSPAAIGSEVRVLDSDGGNWAEGGVQVLDNTVTQPLRAGLPAGEYTVQWRVVSADAHPISNEFSFSVASGTAGSAGAGAPATGSGTGSAAAPVPSSTQAPVLNHSEDTASPWRIIIPAAVVLVAAAVVIALVVRRRLRED